MKKALIIGSTVCDVVIGVDHLPISQEDIHPNYLQQRVGGCAYNVVNVLHNTFVPYTFISPVGTGLYGEYIRKNLRENNIETSIYLEEENGFCLCLVEKNGERTFISSHGIEYTFNKKWCNLIDFNDFSYAYVCGLEIEESTGEELVEYLEECNIPLVFAPGSRIDHIEKERIERLFSLHPIVHLNENELLQFTRQSTLQQGAKDLYQRTKNYVVVTCGERGCGYFDGKTWREIEGIKTTVIDTIGAGDSHCGAMISSLCKGDSMEDALEFANLVASRVVNSSSSFLSKEEYLELHK